MARLQLLLVLCVAALASGVPTGELIDICAAAPAGRSIAHVRSSPLSADCSSNKVYLSDPCTYMFIIYKTNKYSRGNV